MSFPIHVFTSFQLVTSNSKVAYGKLVSYEHFLLVAIMNFHVLFCRAGERQENITSLPVHVLKSVKTGGLSTIRRRFTFFYVSLCC